MKEQSFITIRNATLATVIGGLVLTFLVPAVRSAGRSALAWLNNAAWTAWELLVSWHSLPGWAWFAVMLLALVGLLSIVSSFWPRANRPAYESYVEDIMYGAKWRWSWLSGQVSSLWCYCTRCDATLVYDDSSCRNYGAETRETLFICEHCNHKQVASIQGGNKSYALGAVKREIYRRIRTGTYKIE